MKYVCLFRRLCPVHLALPRCAHTLFLLWSLVVSPSLVGPVSLFLPVYLSRYFFVWSVAEGGVALRIDSAFGARWTPLPGLRPLDPPIARACSSPKVFIFPLSHSGCVCRQPHVIRPRHRGRQAAGGGSKSPACFNRPHTTVANSAKRRR